jgi:hypothetical protein
LGTDAAGWKSATGRRVWGDGNARLLAVAWTWCAAGGCRHGTKIIVGGTWHAAGKGCAVPRKRGPTPEWRDRRGTVQFAAEIWLPGKAVGAWVESHNHELGDCVASPWSHDHNSHPTRTSRNAVVEDRIRAASGQMPWRLGFSNDLHARISHSVLFFRTSDLSYYYFRLNYVTKKDSR